MLLLTYTFTTILIIIMSANAQQTGSFNLVIKCEDEDCLRVTLTFSYKSNSYKYSLIRNDDLFASNFKSKSTSNRYYIDDKGTPFTAVRIGKSKQGVRGVTKVDGKLKAIAYDNATGLHYFEAEEDIRMSMPFDDEVIVPPQAHLMGEIGPPKFDGKEPFPLLITMTVDKTTLRKWFGGDEGKVIERAEEVLNIAARHLKVGNVIMTFHNFFVLEANIGTKRGNLVDYIEEYRQAMNKLPDVNAHHLYHGLTGSRDPTTPALGAAYPKGVCIPEWKVGVSTVTLTRKHCCQ